MCQEEGCFERERSGVCSCPMISAVAGVVGLVAGRGSAQIHSRCGGLARMIHDCFCCNRGFVAATSLDAVAWRPGRRVRRSVNMLF